ncbi:MAG: ABC transporter substrate-binding protein [Anaerolineae bacterium]|nr:ABC transporter substrate-binding protein [Anaerolineae bacterium]
MSPRDARRICDPPGTCLRPTRRRVWAGLALGLVLLVALLAGCAELPSASTEERRILVLWHTLTGAEANALETLTDQFNAENPRRLVLVTEFQENVLEKLQAAPDRRPDLITLWPADLAAYVALGMVGAVPSQSAEIQAAWPDFLPMAGALYQANGVPQALPLGLATYLSYSNNEWLADLGYDPDMASWEDFRRTACAATDPVRGQVGVGVPARASMFLAFLTASGSNVVGADGYYQFADAPGHDAASLLKTIFSGGCGALYEDRDVGMARLGRSSMAMIAESSESLLQIEQAILTGRNFDVSVNPLPGPNGPGPTLWYGPGLMITASDVQHQEAALEAMAWFLSPEAQQIWGSTTRYLPIRRSVIESELENGEQTPTGALSAKLWQLTLDAADQGTWVAWPQATNRITCRASLLRGLLALQDPEADAAAYVDTAVTACNTGVEFRLPATPEPTGTPAP